MLLQFRFALTQRSFKLFAWAYLLLLLLGYGSAGWLLAAFGVPWLVWVGTLGITGHLIKAETDAIVLANVWVVAIVMVGVVIKAWVPQWGSRVPFEQAQLWAIGLLLLWLWAMILVALLAVARKPLRSIGLKTAQRLIPLIWAALGCGGCIYHIAI